MQHRSIRVLYRFFQLLDRLEERLKTEGHMVVRFNAWETDLSNDAFISFADSFFTQLAKYLSDTSQFFEKADLNNHHLPDT